MRKVGHSAPHFPFSLDLKNNAILLLQSEAFDIRPAGVSEQDHCCAGQGSKRSCQRWQGDYREEEGRSTRQKRAVGTLIPESEVIALSQKDHTQKDSLTTRL